MQEIQAENFGIEKDVFISENFRLDNDDILILEEDDLAKGKLLVEEINDIAQGKISACRRGQKICLKDMIQIDPKKPLSEEREKMAENPSLVATAKRTDAYFEKHPKNKFNLTYKSSLGGGIGFGGGMLAGGTGGFAVGGVPGMLAGGTGGGIAGGLLGYFGTKEFCFYGIKNSDLYKNFCFEKETQEVIEEYEEFLEKHHEFDEFLCPITHDFIKVPVRQPGQKAIYEKNAIEEMLVHNGNHEDISPFREGIIKRKELEYVYDYLPRLLQTMKTVMSQEKLRMKQTLGKYLQQKMYIYDKSRREALKAISSEFFELFMEEKIGEKDYLSYSRDLKELGLQCDEFHEMEEIHGDVNEID